MITCLIVDDNDLSRLTLHQLALQTGRLRVTGECKDAIEAHRNITANPPNLVLLDVEMPGMTGLDLLKILPKQTLAILTTSQRHYAAEAFENTTTTPIPAAESYRSKLIQEIKLL